MKNARLLRRARLSNKADYRNVFAQAEASRDAFFTVLARPNQLAFPRLGLAISRKAAKSAVARNRIKRIVRNSFRQRQQDLRGIDIVVIGRIGLETCSNARLFDSLDKHWARLIAMDF